MAEFGCTYRKALESYIGPETTVSAEVGVTLQTSVATENRFSEAPIVLDEPLQADKPNPEVSHRSSYAQVTRTKASVHNEQAPKAKLVQSQKAKKDCSKDDWIFWSSAHA